MKTCFKCNQVKQLSEFYKHSQMKDGHLNKCKECAKADVSDKYQENRDIPAWLINHRKIARDKQKLRTNKIQSSSSSKRKWILKNQDKRAAHVAVGGALLTGRLEKMSCIKCGSPESQAHHENYSKPLEVTWMCITCHNELHVSIRESNLLNH